MKKEYIEITEAEAREIYCKGENVYITNEKRTLWKLPASYEYTSNAPAKELFYRSIPECEGKTEIL